MHKVPCVPIRRQRRPVHFPGTAPLPFTRCAPYVYSAGPTGSGIVHRVREGGIIRFGAKFSHVGVTCWCGQHRYPGPGRSNRAPAYLTDSPPPAMPICGKCEYEAVRRNQPPSCEFTPRPVFYDPGQYLVRLEGSRCYR